MGTPSRSRSAFRRLACLAILLAGAVAAAAALVADVRHEQAAPEPKGERVTIGVLRRDGFLSPFASFEHGDWSVPWPNPDRVAALPIGLDDVPKKWWGAAGPGAPWTAWLLDGTKRPLKLIAPVTIPVFCVLRLAVSTDYRGGPFDRAVTVPKDGVAIAGAAALLPIEKVALDSADAREIVSALTGDFNKEETAASKRFTRWKHPIAENDRRRMPIEIEAFYRSSEKTPRGTWTTNYVELVRKFPPGPQDEGCGLITFARAWVHQQPGQKSKVDLGAVVTYCDRSDVSFMLPFGRVRLDDDIYWVYQTSSWRDELYSVSRVRPKEVRPMVVVSGGFCLR